MNGLKIKIYHQPQANKPVFLLQNGSIICGTFTYQGNQTKAFRQIYTDILERAYKKPTGNVLDISKSRVWYATTIQDELIDPKARGSISARKIYKLACETEIKWAIDLIIPIFAKAVHSRWQKIFRQAPTDPSTPKIPWQIL
jgi:hypothetical protein